MKITINVDEAHLHNLICSAGIAYWADTLDGPLVKGVFSYQVRRTLLDENERSPRWHAVTTKKVRKAVRVIAEKYPHHLAGILDDTVSDANTGDALIQCAIFGELRYG